MTNKTFFALILSAMMCVPFTMSAQVTIGSGRAPSEWSLLDLCTDEQRKALHNARMDRIQRDLLMSPEHPQAERLAAHGLLIFHLDAIAPGVGCLEFWNGTRWVSLCEERLPPPPPQPTIPIPDPFVGAFWRNNQQGERLIRMTHPNGNGWTASTDVSWVRLDTYYRPLIAPGAAHPIQTDTPHLPGSAGQMVSGSGTAIYFRIGLTGTHSGAPRYGRIVVTFNNGLGEHIIWLRQGEEADYLMHRTLDGNRPNARRFSPFNLTVTSLANGRPNNALLNQAGVIPARGGGFVWYPTQSGAGWQWAGRAGFERVAISPVGLEPPPVLTQMTGWGSVAGGWNNMAAVHETCPPGWRRPSHGYTDGTAFIMRYHSTPSEVRESLFLTLLAGSANSFDNSVRGFYADGFFDRHTRNSTTHSNNPANASTTGIMVQYTTPDIGREGTLFFNPRNNASLFFADMGARTYIRNSTSATGRPSSLRIGNFWTSTRSGIGMPPNNHNYGNSNAISFQMNVNVRGIASAQANIPSTRGIRCVRE